MRKLLDRFESDFHPGGKWEKLYPLFEAIDTFLYKPKSTTKNSSHVRDNIDLKRVMITVWLATFPAMFFGMWNIGFQANSIMADIGMTSQDGIRGAIIGLLAGYDATSIWDNMIHGAAYFLPIYITTFVVGITWEIIFATVRKHEVNEGFFCYIYLIFTKLSAGLATLDGRYRYKFWCCDRERNFWWYREKFSKSGFNWKGLLIFCVPCIHEWRRSLDCCRRI